MLQLLHHQWNNWEKTRWEWHKDATYDFEEIQEVAPLKTAVV